LKLLLVTHRFPPSVGGMENQCYELYKGLSLKYQVVLCSMPQKASHIWFLLSLKSRIKKTLKNNPDITHVYFNDALIATAAPAVKKISDKIHTIATVHGLDVVYPSVIYQKKIIGNLNRSIDTVVAVSQATADECVKRGIAKEKVVVVPNGVDLTIKDIPTNAEFNPQQISPFLPDLKNKKILVSIGRSVRRKGVSWFLRSVVPKLGDDYFYIIVGPPQKKLKLFRFLFFILPSKISRLIELSGIAIDQVEVMSLLKREDIKNRAAYVGKIPFDKMVQLLRCSTAFVMPNVHVEGDAEGFGLVALEAVINGTVALVSELEGITEAIRDEENGFYVESESVSDWIGKIRYISSPDFNRTNFTDKAVKYTCQNFSWDKMVEGYSCLLKNGKE